MAGQHYCLRWNNYQSNMTSVFHHLLQNESFVDVTLACNENSLKAHKVVLSACSSYFQKLLLDNPCKHPTIILPEEVCFDDLKFIIDFVYKGEIDVSQAELQSLLRTADQLRIKGLCESPEDDNEMEYDEGNDGNSHSKIDIQRRSNKTQVNRNNNSRFSSPYHQQGKRKQENNNLSSPLSCVAKKCLIKETTKMSSDHVTQLLNNTIDANQILNSNHEIDQQFGNVHGNSVAVATSTEEDEMDIKPLREIKSNISMQMVILDDDDIPDNNNHSNNTSQQSNNNNNQIQIMHTTSDIVNPTCTTLTPLQPQPRQVMSEHNQHQQSEMNSHDQIRHQLQSHVHIHQNSLNDECISRDVEMAVVTSQPPAPTATPVHCHQLDMQHESPSRCNLTGNTNVDSRNDQYADDAVKVEFETLRTMDQSSDSLETMENHLSDRSMTDDEHNMQTMMITPELLGLMPSSSSNQSEIGSDGRKSATALSKTWNSEDMDMALDALRNHNMSLTKASVTFGIPSTTLWQRAHRLGIDTPKKEGLSKSWNEDILNVALEALRSGSISANKASKAYGIPSSTLYKIARKEGIRLAAPFNATPTTWNPEDLERALEAIKSGQTTVQRAATEYGIPSGTLYGRCKREKIELSRSNPTPWSEDAMTEALDTVRLGHMSINQAAIHYNLPYSSLYGRFKRGKYEADHSDQTEESNVDNSSGLLTQQLQSQSDSQVNQNHIQPQIMLLQYPTSTAHIQMYQSTTSSYDK